MSRYYGTRAILLTFLLIVFCGSAYSQNISKFLISPSETFISTPTTLSITAEVSTSVANALVKDSVLLYETTAAGKLLALAGKMYDDGSHGDATANDGIYSSQIVINEPSPLTRFYKVSAAYSGVRNRSLSETMTMEVYPHLPHAIMDQAALSVKTIQDNFNSNVTTLGLSAAQTQALAEALAHPNIGPGNANLSGDDLSLFYVYVDPATDFKFKLAGIVSVSDPSIPSLGGGLTPLPTIPLDAKLPTSDKLLIFAPFYSADLPFTADYAKERFGVGQYMTFNPNPPFITSDANASLDVIRSWGNYGTIIVSAHGNVFDINGDPAFDGFVVFASGTPSSEKNSQIELDLAKHRIGYRSLFSEFPYYFVFPSFISKYVGSMKDTFFHLGMCSSLKNDTLWNVLKDKGAKLAFGYDKKVSIGHDKKMFGTLMDRMLPLSEATDPLNAKKAFDSISDKIDTEIFPPAVKAATFIMKTASVEWEKFLFVEPKRAITLLVSGTVSGYTLPALITLNNLYPVNQLIFEIKGTAGNTCGTGERGFPPFSHQVDLFADFFGAPTVLGVPSQNSGPFGGSKPCSSFFANIRDAAGHGKVWINATSRARQFGGAATFDWEYQVRYYSGDPALNYSDKSCMLGVVPNSGFYVGHPVTCNVACDNNLFGKLPSNAPACN